MLRKSPDTGISLCRGPFPSEGNLVCGGGARIPGTLRVITPFVGNAVLRRKPQSILCECEALASLGHTYLGSFFMDGEDITKLSIGTIWNFVKGIGLL